MFARDDGDDADRLAAHFGGHLSRETLPEALEYAEWFPDEIDNLIAENERVAGPWPFRAEDR